MVDGTIASIGRARGAGRAHGRGRPPGRGDRRGRASGCSSCLRTHGGEQGTNVAELGIGTNEKAELTGELLEDEKILGTLPRRLRRLGGDRGHGPGAGAPRLRRAEARREHRRRAARARGRAPGRLIRRGARGPQLLRGARRRRDRGDRCRASAAPSCSTATPTRSTTAPCSRLSRQAPGIGRGAGRRRPGVCIERIDMSAHEGAHPCVGALDVCPVRLDRRGRSARSPASSRWRRRWRSPSSAVPVFLYGELALGPRAAPSAPSSAAAGSPSSAERMRSGELRPDFGPAEPHPTAGATLVTARPPLAAFNLELDTDDARRRRSRSPPSCASRAAESAGVRAVGVDLGDRAQVSTNIHDPVAVPLAAVDRAGPRAGRRARRRGRSRGEIVGLVPEAALRGCPSEVPLPALRSRGPGARARAAESQPPT